MSLLMVSSFTSYGLLQRAVMQYTDYTIQEAYSGGDINVLRLYCDNERPLAGRPQGGHRLVVSIGDYNTVYGGTGEGTKLHAIGTGENCYQHAVKSSPEDYVKTWATGYGPDYSSV